VRGAPAGSSTARPSAPRADTDPEAGASDLEVEVKFAVEQPAAIEALLAHPDPTRLAGFEPAGPEVDRVVVDRYLDTAAGDGSLRAAGLRARLRISPSGVVLAVKGRASVAGAGVSTRMELEAPATADLDPARWAPSPGRTLVMETIGGAPLVEIAAVRQARLVRNVRCGGSVVELSLDRLTALGPDGEELATRLELEAELKTGSAAVLEELAGALPVNEGLGAPPGHNVAFALAAPRGP